MLALDDGEMGRGRGLTQVSAFSFAGLDFELLGDDRANGRLLADLGGSRLAAQLLGSSAGARKLSVRCYLAPHESSPAGALAAPPLPRAGLGWSWRDGEGEVLSRFGHAMVRATGGGFEARLRVGDDVRAAQLLFRGLAALVLHHLGGCILHAASVEQEGAVLAFVGPSGAGKSTAARQVRGARLFSADTLVLLPSSAERSDGTGQHPELNEPALASWLAHPLPGGSRPCPDMPSASPRWLPLASVLRVHQTVGEPKANPAAPAARVALLRESAFQIGMAPVHEHELLATLERLSRRVPIGRLQLPLGACLNPVLSRWLVDPPAESRC